MKYLITESSLNGLIETFLKKKFDDIVDIKFVKRQVYLASDNETIERTVIQVLVDPYEILQGNFEANTMRLIGKLKSDIWETLDKFFSLKLKEYGSKWEVEIFILSTIK
jgi:hypothetical protein